MVLRPGKDVYIGEELWEVFFSLMISGVYLLGFFS